MSDSNDEGEHSQGDGNTRESLSIFNVKSDYNIGQDAMMIPCSSNSLKTSVLQNANDVKIHNETFYDMVCTTMKKIDSEARTSEKATLTGQKRVNARRANAVPRKKSHDCEVCMGKLNLAKPRRKERRNPKKRDRALSSESNSSSRSESSH